MSNGNGNVLGTHHDPGPVGLNGCLSDNAADIIHQLSSLNKNGFIDNALLVWIDIQIRSTPEHCWLVEAQMMFTDKQITEARTLPCNIARVNCDKIGEVKGYMDAEGKIHCRKGEKKSAESLSDIHKLVIKLQELQLIPLLLGTSEAISRLPAFNTNPKEIDKSDVMNRI